MSLFKKKGEDVLQNASRLTGEEIIETYARLNLYQKAALLRLLVRDVIFKINKDEVSGLNFTEIKVDGAIIIAEENS
jgi:ribosomal protein L16 Arg81 hydroxylase